MRYGSVCSGIEAASVAWRGLGWECAFVSEIEPFPAAVLAEHFPTVPNLGDFTQIKPCDYSGSIDLLVGGTPCQSFSIAGLRKGLEDARGNLALEFARLAYRTQPRWLVWENVPGVLSSEGGRDFATFLSLLVGWEVRVPDGGKWKNSGIITGARGCYNMGWRVLDAQYTRVEQFPWAIPQRRRRVILVGSIGSWTDCAAVLFDGEMCGGDAPPCRKAREKAASNSQGGLGASTIRERAGKPGGGKGALISKDVSLALATGNDQKLFDPNLSWWDGGQCTSTLTTRSIGQTMPDKNQLPCVVDTRWHNYANDGTCPSLLASDYKEPKAVVDPCPTLDASYPTKQNNQDFTKLVCYPSCDAVAIAENVIGRKVENGGNGVGAKVGVCYTLDTVGVHGVCYPIDMMNVDGRGDEFKAKCYGEPNSAAYSLTHRRPSGVCMPGVVRRLLPIECERLMGMPDNWTQISWRGKPKEECPDGPRYKALGNSMCTNVMAWIGERIDIVDKEKYGRQRT